MFTTATLNQEHSPLKPSMLKTTCLQQQTTANRSITAVVMLFDTNYTDHLNV